MSDTIHPLYDKKVECPFCSHSFTTKKVRSRFTRPIKTETDFYTIYKYEVYNPLLYVPAVCPRCGYTFTDQFSKLMSDQAKMDVTEKLANRWTPQDYTSERTEDDALRAYKLAIYTAQLKREKAIVVAGLYLRLVWIYRKIEDDHSEKRFMRLAEQTYKQAYEEDDLTNSEMNSLKVLYLIGELNRRLGNDQEAIRYFSKVVEKKQLAFDPKVIEMARDQWYQTREDQKQMKHPLVQ